MRILLGTGTTDANGNVTVTYTGVGAGKVQLMAECGTIQSETYVLYDCLIKDTGITGTSTDLFGNMSVFTRGETGTQMYYENTGSTTFSTSFSNRVAMNGGELALDFELISNTYCNVQTARYESGKTTQYEQFWINGTGDVHMEFKEEGTFIYLNDNLIRSDTSETNNEEITLFFRALSGDTADFTYKNLKVYPI